MLTCLGVKSSVSAIFFSRGSDTRGRGHQLANVANLTVGESKKEHVDIYFSVGLKFKRIKSCGKLLIKAIS